MNQPLICPSLRQQHTDRTHLRSLSSTLTQRLAAIFSLLICSLLSAQIGEEPPRRAAPPKFDASAGEDIFFSNAVKDGLRGERPSHLGKKPTMVAGAVGPGGGGTSAVSTSGWSRLISGDTIENTIKSKKSNLDKIITQPAAFASGGNRKARREFVALTAMFAIIVEFDGDVRWKSDAMSARDRCRNAAAVCKVGSVQAFNAAKATKDEISDLVGGNNLPPGAASPNKWQDLTDRGSLMQQLEALFDDLIKPAVANDNSFKSQADEILAAAELSSAIAEILMKEEMDDAGDDDYEGYCKQIQTAAQDITDAIKQNNGGAARTASGMISKACSECHESYR